MTDDHQGRARRTRTLYERILEGFRQYPGNVKAAARFANCNYRTAKKVWEVGWPRSPWAAPGKEVLRAEHDKAMAIVGEKLRAEHEAANADRERATHARTEARALDEQILLAARKNVAAAFGLSAKLVPAMDALVGVIRNAVLDPATGKPKPDPGLGPKDAMSLLARHTAILTRAFDVGERIIQMGRLEDGKPNAVVGLSLIASMSPEEAAVELDAQDSALELIREEARLLREASGVIDVEGEDS